MTLAALGDRYASADARAADGVREAVCGVDRGGYLPPTEYRVIGLDFADAAVAVLLGGVQVTRIVWDGLGWGAELDGPPWWVRVEMDMEIELRRG